MDTKHTPGPWTYTPQPVESNGFYIQTFDMSHRNTFIGEAGGGLQTPQEIKANAKLIAAAPDLLEALEALMEEYENIGNTGDCGYFAADQQEVYIKAMAAIRKATA